MHTRIPVTRFAAIDFETADYGRDSACAEIVIKAGNEGLPADAFLQPRR